MQVSASFPDIVTTVTDERPLEVPHTFFGVVSGGASEVARAMRRFVTTGIRQGRPFARLVTYNTWYADGVRIDERQIMNEINQAAALGVELFVLDAGWYPRAGAYGPFDFDTGLGSWTADPERFPNGLRPLVEFAHAHNMKFGLWVEPGRVDLDTVGEPGLADAAWLATRDGRNVSERMGQICLGTARARRWLLEQLTNLLDTVQPDYLKWDNNMWLNCDREDHDHGSRDGNLAQVRGLYDVLQTLRDRYPDLLIENVADGGSRMDFGWLRYSDAAWVDDRTQPSAHVRHNLQGLSLVFPPEYLLSFLVDDPDEPLAGAPDLAASIRSRMLGTLGFSHSVLALRESIAWPIVQAIGDYRAIRDTLSAPDTILLSGQVGTGLEVGWDVVEQVDADNGNAVIFAFQHPDGDGRLLLRPTRLRADATYEIRSVDVGPLGTALGDALMTDGVEFVQDDAGSRAHVLVLRVQ
jgi:alpha-galactosidase